MSALTIRDPNDGLPPMKSPDYTVSSATAREVIGLLAHHYGLATVIARGEITRDGTVTLRVRDVTVTIAPTAGGAR